jgi:hypothetical protein
MRSKSDVYVPISDALPLNLIRVPEHEPNILHPSLGRSNTPSSQSCFDCGEIACVLFMDDVPVVRDVEGDGVDRPVEYPCPSIGVSKCTDVIMA